MRTLEHRLVRSLCKLTQVVRQPVFKPGCLASEFSQLRLMQFKGTLENVKFPSPLPLPSSIALPHFHLLLWICGGVHMWLGSSETTSLRMKTENVEPWRSVELTWRVFAIRKNRCCLSQEEMSVRSKPCFRKPLCFMTLGASSPFNFVFCIPVIGGPL